MVAVEDYWIATTPYSAARLEHMLRLYPLDEKPPDGWVLPGPFSLGEFSAPVEQWRQIANAPRESPEDPE